MGVELFILGIRKLRKKEIKELTGKTVIEMEKSEYYLRYFPSAPYNSHYCTYSPAVLRDEGYKNIRHLFTPVRDAYGDYVYVIWKEELGYYWHKNQSDREKIERLLHNIGDVDWNQSYHVAAYDDISGYTDRRPSVMNTEEELVVFSYG